MRAKLIACATVGEELDSLIPAGMPYKVLEFGLHCTPEKLHAALQAEIDQTTEEVDTILLGYGMCSRGVLGLEAGRFRLVVPRLDDCLGLFLGSRAAYQRQQQSIPGTFYLTRGWIECGDDPYTEFLKMVEKYGHERAYRAEMRVIANYKRVLLVNTGSANQEKYRAYAQHVAEFFNLEYEEIEGSNRMIQMLLGGDWNHEFVIVEPGEKVTYDLFAL